MSTARRCEAQPRRRAKIDDHSNVKRWLRNTDTQTQGGFFLPKSPGRFYPDFIVELNDSTIVLVEYKNRKLASDDEEKHKKAVGEFWESRSNGRCRFAYIVEEDWGELERKLAP